MKIVGVDGEDSVGSHDMRFETEICSGTGLGAAAGVWNARPDPVCLAAGIMLW
jgi:hypothetical protein